MEDTQSKDLNKTSAAIILSVIMIIIVAGGILLIKDGRRQMNNKSIKNAATIQNQTVSAGVLSEYGFLYHSIDRTADKPVSKIFKVERGNVDLLIDFGNKYIIQQALSPRGDYLGLVMQDSENTFNEFGLLDIKTKEYKTLDVGNIDEYAKIVWDNNWRLYYQKKQGDTPLFLFIDLNDYDPYARSGIVYDTQNGSPVGTPILLGGYNNTIYVSSTHFEPEQPVINRVYLLVSDEGVGAKFKEVLNLDAITASSRLTYPGYISWEDWSKLVWTEEKKLKIRDIHESTEQEYVIEPVLQTYISPLSPGGEYIIFEKEKNSDGRTPIALYDLNKRSSTVIDSRFPIEVGQWVSDGQYFIYSTKDGIYSFSVNTQTIQTLPSFKIDNKFFAPSNLIGFFDTALEGEAKIALATKQIVTGTIDLKNNFTATVPEGWEAYQSSSDLINIVKFGSPAQTFNFKKTGREYEYDGPSMFVQTFTIDSRLLPRDVANLIGDQKVADTIDTKTDPCLKQIFGYTFTQLDNYAFQDNTATPHLCRREVTEPSLSEAVILKDKGNSGTLMAILMVKNMTDYIRYVSDFKKFLENVAHIQ